MTATRICELASERERFVQALDGMLWDEVFETRLRHRGDALIAYDAALSRPAAVDAAVLRAEAQSSASGCSSMAGVSRMTPTRKADRLLLDAARIIEREAAAIRRDCVIGRTWPSYAKGVRADYDEMRQVAKLLRTRVAAELRKGAA